MNHVRNMNKGALHTRAAKGESVVEQLHKLECKVLKDEASTKRRLAELEMSIKNLAENIQVPCSLARALSQCWEEWLLFWRWDKHKQLHKQASNQTNFLTNELSN
jgi:hypothetical protein